MAVQSQTLTDTQSFLATATPKDASGNPGVLAASTVPTWSSDNTAVATVSAPAADGLSTTVTGVAPGVANIAVSMQAPNALFVTSTFQAIVTGGPVSGATFSFSTPA